MRSELEPAKVSGSQQGNSNILRISDSGFPIPMPNGADDAVEELLDTAGPAPAPSDCACLALPLVSAQLVNAHTLGQPQGPGERDVLVETLLQ